MGYSCPCRSQKYSWGWKGTMELILSNFPAQARPPRASCPGPCLDSFWTSPRTEKPQPFWATCPSAQLPLLQKKGFLMLRGDCLCLFVPTAQTSPWLQFWHLPSFYAKMEDVVSQLFANLIRFEDFFLENSSFFYKNLFSNSNLCF